MTSLVVVRRRVVRTLAVLALGAACWAGATGVATAASGGANSHDGRTGTSTQQSSDQQDSDHGDMPGMDHGSSSEEMPGMEPGDEMPGMDHDATPMSVPDPERPLGLVLGGFGTATAAVLVAAAILRRRDLVTRANRRAAHAGARS